jgi:hypothetical protein
LPHYRKCDVDAPPGAADRRIIRCAAAAASRSPRAFVETVLESPIAEAHERSASTGFSDTAAHAGGGAFLRFEQASRDETPRDAKTQLPGTSVATENALGEPAVATCRLLLPLVGP